MERNRSKKAKSLRAAGLKPSESQFVTPPSYNSQRVITWTQRYKQNATLLGDNFVLSDGHKSLMMVTVNAASATPLCDMWRIRSIDFYLSGDQREVTITTIGNDNSNNFVNSRERTITLTSANDAQCVKKSLKRRDQYDPLFSWHHTNGINFAGGLLSLSSSDSAGLIMDVHYCGILNTVGGVLGYGAVTSNILGIIGCQAVINSKMDPVGINIL